MSTSRLALALVVLSVLPACEVDEPPPATPQSVAVQPPPPPVAPGEEPGAQAGGSDGMYASGEYTLGADPDAYDDNDPAALTDFRPALDRHGTWADDPKYGTVWVPNASEVGADFTPYLTAGHWAYDDDYVWVSDYEWGWAPFHYGHWIDIDGRGWAWVPGRIYRGAWVEWGYDDGFGYVGWYPWGPPFLWFGGMAVAYDGYIGPRWVYCPRGEVFSPSLPTRVVAGPSVAGVAARVHMASNPAVGPRPAQLGLAAAQVPHVSGAAAASIARAQQFARPSTATALGARPPYTPPASAMGTRSWGPGPARPGLVGSATPSTSGGKKPLPADVAPRPRATGHASYGGLRPGVAPAAAPPSGGSFHGGGGGFHGGGGGGGHHR